MSPFLDQAVINRDTKPVSTRLQQRCADLVEYPLQTVKLLVESRSVVTAPAGSATWSGTARGRRRRERMPQDIGRCC
ncbi:MAG: hypothetical protein ACRYG4_26790, partial [Janthinobacterium lividum]